MLRVELVLALAGEVADEAPENSPRASATPSPYRRIRSPWILCPLLHFDMPYIRQFEELWLYVGGTGWVVNVRFAFVFLFCWRRRPLHVVVGAVV